MFRGRDRWALLALTALVAIAFREVIGPRDGLWFGDHTEIFRQRWWFIVEALRQGHLPAKTLANGSGVPIESLLNATYTPLVILFWLGPFDVVYDLFVAAHVLVACTGVYVLFRSLGFSAIGSFWAALVPLSGPIISFENLLVGLQGMAYAPWVYWALARLLRTPTASAIGVFGLFGGWHLQGIMPEILLLDVIVGLVLLAAFAPREAAARVRLAATLTAAIGLAWAVAAIELMPVVEGLAETRRGQGFSYAEQAAWSVRPAQWYGLVVPSFWTLPEIGLARFDWLYDGQPRPYLLSIYAGLLVSVGLARRPAVIFALAAAGLFAIVALGDLTPVHGWLARLPVMTSARYPVKFLVLSMAALTVALAYAPTRLMRASRPPLALLLHAAAAVGLWAWLTRSEYVGALADELSPLRRTLHGVEADFLPALTELAQAHRLAHAVAFSALAVLVFVVAKAPRARVLSITAVVALDIGWAAGYAIRGAPVDVGPSPALRAALAGLQNRIYRLGPNDLDAPIVVDPDRPLWPQIVTDNARRGLREHRDQRAFYDYDPDGQSNPVSAATLELIHGSRYPEAEVLLGRIGVKTVNTWAPVRRPGLQTFDIPGQSPQRTFAIEPHRPYADAFARWRTVDPEPGISADDRRHLQALDTWDTLLVLDLTAAAPTTEGEAAVACRRNARIQVAPPSVTGDVSLSAELPCRAMILIQETYLGRWTARIDGQPAAVYQAEMGQTAVLSPAGVHRIELIYGGRIHRWWPVSAAAFIAAVVLILISASSCGPLDQRVLVRSA